VDETIVIILLNIILVQEIIVEVQRNYYRFQYCWICRLFHEM